LDRELIKKQREIDESLRKDPDKRLSREEADMLLPIFTTEQKKLLRIFLKRKRKEKPHIDQTKISNSLNPLDLPEEFIESFFLFDPETFFTIQRYFPKQYWREYMQRRVGNSRIYNSKEKELVIKKGKRGGRYTEDTTKDGRPYRRYF